MRLPAANGDAHAVIDSIGAGPKPDPRGGQTPGSGQGEE